MVRLDHINMSVDDLQTSIDWYHKVFKFEVVEKGEHNGKPFAIVRNNESMLCLYQLPERQSPEKSPHHRVFHYGLRIENQHAWEEHVVALNLQPNLVWDYPHSKSWYLSDPTGHEIEVCYWKNNTIQFDPVTS